MTRPAAVILALVSALLSVHTTSCKKKSRTSAGPGSAPGPTPATATFVPVPTGATPEQAFAGYQRALKARDLDFLWSFVSARDKAGTVGQRLAPMNGGNVPAARMAEFEQGFGKSAAEIRAMSKLDFDKNFIWMVVGRGAILITEQTIAKVELSAAGDEAVLELAGPSSKLALVREDGQWHFDMGGTSAANRK